MQSFSPSEALKPFIHQYLIIETNEGRLNRILPSTSLTMAFRIKGNVAYRQNEQLHILPSLIIAGLQKGPRLVQYSSETTNLIVSFKEGAAHFFFEEPMHELLGQSVSLDHFISQQTYSLLEEQLMEAKNHSLRVQLIEKFLLSRLEADSADRLISVAIQKIKACQGILEVKTFVKELGISQDVFEKRFRRVTGTTPKHFASIIRMKGLLQHFNKNNNYTQLALQYGFFDQAHFNKQFKLFTGQTPGEYMKNSSAW